MDIQLFHPHSCAVSNSEAQETGKSGPIDTKTFTEGSFHLNCSE